MDYVYVEFLVILEKKKNIINDNQGYWFGCEVEYVR